MRHGQHRPHTAVQGIGDASRLVEDQQFHAAERADGPFLARQAQDARAVCQLQVEARLTFGGEMTADGAVAVEDLAIDFAALPQRRRQQQDESVWREQGRVQGESGDGRRFAALARAIEQNLPIGRDEQLALPRIGSEAAGAEDRRGIKRQVDEMLDVHHGETTGDVYDW